MIEKKWWEGEWIYYLFFILILCVYVTAMLITIMDIDAAQLASISDQMLDEHSFLQVKHRDIDYLDKPPLLFWAAALTIRLFGIGSISYKLLPVLGLIFSVYCIYRLVRLYYSKETALVASVILASCQAYFTMANDIRAENLLIGSICFAIWQLSAYLETKKPLNLYAGFAGIGLAMLAKGPIGIILPAFTIGSMLIVKKNYRAINFRWLMAIPIIGLILLPMCIGLYLQHGTKGLEFYFWTQSFGRITGQSEWQNSAGPFFFAHSFMWIFLPFSIIFLPALYTSFRDIIKGNPATKLIEYGSLGGFMITMIALSFSNYKLPHYIYIVCPLAAVLTAVYITEKIKLLNIKILHLIQMVSMALLLASSVVLFHIFNEGYPVFLIALLLGVVTAFWWLWRNLERWRSLVLISALVMTFINLELNTAFYPKLLTYQSPSEAAFYIRENKIDTDKIISYNVYGNSMSYYLDTIVPFYSEIEDLKMMKDGTLVYTDEEGLRNLKKANLNFRVLRSFDDFPVTRVTFMFLSPGTREEVTSKRHLVRLSN